MEPRKDEIKEIKSDDSVSKEVMERSPEQPTTQQMPPEIPRRAKMRSLLVVVGLVVAATIAGTAYCM